MQVTELFRSIQGEGRNQGRPCTFVRFSGCNLRCTWCDTTYAWEGGMEMSADEIEAELRSLGGKYLCITGGEPLLQGEPLVQLVRSLARQGYAIDIETNGTINFSPYQPYASICMDIKCPSSGGRSDLTFLPLISSGDCVRFVVADRADLEYAARVMRGQPIAGEIFFSPVSGSDPREAANFILERDLPARLQLQLHKFLGVR